MDEAFVLILLSFKVGMVPLTWRQFTKVWKSVIERPSQAMIDTCLGHGARPLSDIGDQSHWARLLQRLLGLKMSLGDRR